MRLVATAFRAAGHRSRRPPRPAATGCPKAHRGRPAALAERLFWRGMEHLKTPSRRLALGQRRGPAFRFKGPISIMDRTTLELVAHGMAWARPRRRKAVAKAPLRLNRQSLLPGFVIVDTTAQHDNRRARELYAGRKSGESPC